MKKIILISCIALFFNCKKKQSDKTLQVKKETKITAKGTIELTLDGKTYIYDDINWEKSRIKNEKTLRLIIRQDELPQIQFRFPDIEKSLADGKDTFSIPDLYRRGFLPITLNFIVTIKDKSSEAVTFRKGKIKASFISNNLKITFDGEGGPALDAETIYPITGTININI